MPLSMFLCVQIALQLVVGWSHWYMDCGTLKVIDEPALETFYEVLKW